MARPITEADFRPHLLARMEQRGVTKAEIDRAVNEGWDAADAKPGHLRRPSSCPTSRSGRGSGTRRKKSPYTTKGRPKA